MIFQLFMSDDTVSGKENHLKSSPPARTRTGARHLRVRLQHSPQCVVAFAATRTSHVGHGTDSMNISWKMGRMGLS